MNEENTKKLISDFPELYRGVDLPITENLMSFGFECGDGWFQLLYDLSSKIMNYCKENNMPVPLVVQVKEKFAELRYYLDGADDQIYKFIDEAEDKSMATCETCGEKGSLHTHGSWLVTVCEKHGIEQGCKKYIRNEMEQ